MRDDTRTLLTLFLAGLLICVGLEQFIHVQELKGKKEQSEKWGERFDRAIILTKDIFNKPNHRPHRQQI